MNTFKVHYFAVADRDHEVGFLYATGVAPQAGYRYELTRIANRFEFRWYPPEIGADVMTPFTHSIGLGDAIGMRSTMVTDNDGEWQVFIDDIKMRDRTPALAAKD